MKKLTYLFLIAISLFCTVNCTVPGDIADGVQSKAQSQIQVQYPKCYFKVDIRNNNYRYDIKYPNVNGVLTDSTYISGNIPNFTSSNYKIQEIDFYDNGQNLEFTYLNVHTYSVYITVHFKTPVIESAFQGLSYHIPRGKTRMIIINPRIIQAPITYIVP